MGPPAMRGPPPQGGGLFGGPPARGGGGPPVRPAGLFGAAQSIPAPQGSGNLGAAYGNNSSLFGGVGSAQYAP